MQGFCREHTSWTGHRGSVILAASLGPSYKSNSMAAMPASSQMWKLQGWQQAWAPHSLQQCWESMLSSFGESGSMIHQKVLWERSKVSGFFNYQLAVPGLQICQPSLSCPELTPSLPLLLFRLYWRRLTESSFCCFVSRFLVC